MDSFANKESNQQKKKLLDAIIEHIDRQANR